MFPGRIEREKTQALTRYSWSKQIIEHEKAVKEGKESS